MNPTFYIAAKRLPIQEPAAKAIPFAVSVSAYPTQVICYKPHFNAMRKPYARMTARTIIICQTDVDSLHD